jgi:hypothetical protein
LELSKACTMMREEASINSRDIKIKQRTDSETSNTRQLGWGTDKVKITTAVKHERGL